MADGRTAKVEVPQADGLRRFTSNEFYRLGEAGIIGPDERVELVDGLIYEMSPINPRHASAVDVLHEALDNRFERAGACPCAEPGSLGR